MVACTTKPCAYHAALVLQVHMHVHICGTCMFFMCIFTYLASCLAQSCIHSILHTLRGSVTVTVLTFHICACCSAWRCFQPEHLHCPFAATSTHSFTRTVLSYFVSTKQIPAQACSLSHTHMLSVAASHLPVTTACARCKIPHFLPLSHIS